MDNVNKSKGEILIDPIFSPVIKVNYDITSARVDKRTDYEKLALDLEQHLLYLHSSELWFSLWLVLYVPCYKELYFLQHFEF